MQRHEFPVVLEVFQNCDHPVVCVVGLALQLFALRRESLVFDEGPGQQSVDLFEIVEHVKARVPIALPL